MVKYRSELTVPNNVEYIKICTMSAKLYTTLLRNIETIISDLIHLLGLGFGV